MMATLNHNNLLIIESINKTMFISYAARPIALKIEFEWFRFSDTLGGVFTSF